MPNLCGTRNLSGIVLAVIAAGSMILPAVAAQSATPSAATHKSSGTGKAAHPSNATSGKKSTAAKSNRKKSRKVKGQTAPTTERISEIQQALARKGATDVTPTGKWDDSTTEALKKFQSTNGLAPTGKLDALTLLKLGLGSETAGLAAPTPPPNAINRLRNTSSIPAEPVDSDSEPRN